MSLFFASIFLIIGLGISFMGVAFKLSVNFLVISYAILLVVFLILLIFMFTRKIKLVSHERIMVKREWLIPLCCFAVLLFATYIYEPLLESRFSIPEMVTTMNDSNKITGINYFTGEEMTQVLTGDDFLNITFCGVYVMLCRIFSLETTTVLFWITPIVTIFLYVSLLLKYGTLFFKGNQTGVACFVIALTVLTLFGSGAYMNSSYGLLFYTYEPTTFISSIFIPYWIYCGLKLIIKKGEKHEGTL